MMATKQPQTDRSSRPKHYPPGVPDSVWAPLSAALLMAIAGEALRRIRLKGSIA